MVISAGRAHAHTSATASAQVSDRELSHLHVLGLGAFVEGGVAFAVGFWSARRELEMHDVAERGPDGGVAPRPLSARAMRRGQYAWRVCIGVFFLAVDLIANALMDTLHLLP